MRRLLPILVLITVLTVTGCQSRVGVSAEQEAMAESLGITVEEMNSMSDEELQRLVIEASASEGES